MSHSRTPEDKARQLVRLIAIDPAQTIDAAARLKDFGRPILLAWGTDDKLFPPEHAQRLAAVAVTFTPNGVRRTASRMRVVDPRGAAYTGAGDLAVVDPDLEVGGVHDGQHHVRPLKRIPRLRIEPPDLLRPRDAVGEPEPAHLGLIDVEVDRNGYGIGTVSGGCLEADVLERAKKVLETGEPTVITSPWSVLFVDLM